MLTTLHDKNWGGVQYIKIFNMTRGNFLALRSVINKLFNIAIQNNNFCKLLYTPELIDVNFSP